MEKDMTLGIGIDTGGTYTDSVIVTLSTGEVLSKAKALTTTLATNSVVENRGSAVGLIMAVPSPQTFDLPQDLPCEASALIAGSHTLKGEEQVSLDREAARNAIRRMDPDVDAFALSGYFSIYNAGHELALAQMVSELTGKPVVCAHELSGAVGMLERAVTAILNARLLPVIRELTGAVETILTDLGIAAPLMVVKGDGALMNLSACRQRPVETVLSGPAASISGACRLSGLDDAVVLDMGGTTTDIAVVRGGRAKVSKEGARVGEWQTRVRAVDMWTLGLGRGQPDHHRRKRRCLSWPGPGPSHFPGRRDRTGAGRAAPGADLPAAGQNQGRLSYVLYFAKTAGLTRRIRPGGTGAAASFFQSGRGGNCGGNPCPGGGRPSGKGQGGRRS